MAPSLASTALYAICAYNTSNYRSFGSLSPCSINATSGAVRRADAPAVFVSSDSSLCNIAFRAAPPRFYVPSEPGGEWQYDVNILDADSGRLEGKVRTAEGMMYTQVRNTPHPPARPPARPPLTLDNPSWALGNLSRPSTVTSRTTNSTPRSTRTETS